LAIDSAATRSDNRQAKGRAVDFAFQLESITQIFYGERSYVNK